MFDRIDLPTFLLEYSLGNLPREFDPKQLPRVSVDQTIWFDETHIQQEGGQISRGGVQIRFPRDTNGTLSPSMDKSSDEMYNEIISKSIFKYAKEVRFCLGICVVKD